MTEQASNETYKNEIRIEYQLIETEQNKRAVKHNLQNSPKSIRIEMW